MPSRFLPLIMGLLILAGGHPVVAQEADGAQEVDGAQAEVAAILKRPLIDPQLPLQEVQRFTESRVLPMPEVSTVAEWERHASRMRRETLEKVVLRGAAAKWADAPLKVEYLERLEGGEGYSIRKLRFEAVPGLWIPALLYEPDNLEGRVPIVLNVNGHDRGSGKAADYKQIRCINMAKRGMLALNPEWVGMGQLNSSGFNHYKINQWDLCGTSGVSVHYLSMVRGLDVLLQHEHADPDRVAVAGLSGGGWQTIFISALDTRVTLSNPVAGYSSFRTRARFLSDLGDSEQTPVDLGTTADYAQLTAMRAPRPTLLTNNANDNCCFKAEHALPPLVEAAAPIYELHGLPENLRTHVNHVPGTHNFGQDNREQLYRMLGDHFYGGLQTIVVRLDPAKLKALGITAESVRERLPGRWEESTSTDGEAIRLQSRLSLLRKGRNPEELLKVTVNTSGGAKVPLAQIASVSVERSGEANAAGGDYSIREIPCDDELLSKEQLTVAVPDDNADIHSIAVKLMQELPQNPEIPTEPADLKKWREQRADQLKEIVRWPEDRSVRAIAESVSRTDRLVATFWWLRVGGDWTIPAVELVPAGNTSGQTVLVLADSGRASAASLVVSELGKGHRVLAFDPFYLGESKIAQRDFLFALLVSAVGERPLGVQAAQTSAIAEWAMSEYGGPVQVIASGPRTSLIALVASGLERKAIRTARLIDSLSSLKQVIEQDLTMTQTPELFCFGLLEQFDIPQLVALAGADRIEQARSPAKTPEPTTGKSP